MATKNQKNSIKVYRCPFCKAENWFDNDYNLALHLYRNHLGDSIREYAKMQVVKVSKTIQKWGLA